MKIVDISIKQPVFITMAILLLVVLGMVSYNRVGVDLMPDITLPIIAVTTVDPGVGPEEIESQITKPIEDAVSSINGIDKVSSTSSDGVSSVIAQFVLEKNAQQAEAEVRDKVSGIRNKLPREIQEPVYNKFDPSDAPVVTYNITSRNDRLSLKDLRTIVDDKIKTLVERVDGVGTVNVIGGLEREIQVSVNTDLLHSLNLSISQVTQAIRAENINLPAGRVTEKSVDFLIRTNAEFKKIGDMNGIVVANPDGNPVYLKDVAEVTDGFKTRRNISRINGVECVTLSIQKQSGTNSVKVADAVRKTIRKNEKNYGDLAFQMTIDESANIKDSRDDVIKSLIEGALLAGLVVFFSFGDIRNTLITIAGLPVCIIATFAVMYFAGFTVNVITLMALSLSIGLLIDDAIVVRENIFRHIEKLGEDPRRAAHEGTTEVGMAVTATTLTLVAVFIPVAFATGIAGKFFKQFGITVSAAVLISLFEAFTFAPMLSAYFFKKVKRGQSTNRFQHFMETFYDRLSARYRPILRWALGHRMVLMAATVVIFILSAALFGIMGTAGMSRGSRPDFNLAVQCVSGSSLENTEQIVRRIENILYKQEDVQTVFTVIGTSDGSSDEAVINVRLKRLGITKKYQDKLRPLLAGIPGAKITFQESFSTTGAAATALRQMPFQINLKSASLADLTLAAEKVKTVISSVNGLVDVNTDYRVPKPEIQILVDRDRASMLGVNTAQIASIMRSLVDGDVASQYRSEEKLIDIRVHAAEDVRGDLDRLSKVFIPTVKGGSISLDQVARLSMVNGPTQIKRNERTRQIVVAANILKGVPLNEVKKEVEAKLEDLELPKDVAVEFGGQVEQTAEMFASLGLAMALAVLFVYMILASQFNSFVQPFAIMLSLPFSISGAALGLLVFNKLFDMTAFIGLIMLMGLVTKNSILLVDYTNILRKRGMKRSEAIVEAGSTRLRPILMTTLAMILGMTPVAFSIGASSDFRAPIGVTIIGGLITSTMLTLVIVPVVYSILDDIVSKKGSKRIYATHS
jgi:hydrophobe/amphiphile efflux-1 (HAE1) family protein